MADDDVGIDVPAHTTLVQVIIRMVISSRSSCIPTTNLFTSIKTNSSACRTMCLAIDVPAHTAVVRVVLRVVTSSSSSGSRRSSCIPRTG